MVKNLVILLTLSWLFFISACNKEASSPEQQIQNLVSTMETSVEQRSLDSVKKLIDSDYQDEWNGNRRAALRALMFYFQGHQSIHLLTRISDIQLSDDEKSATATVYVGMSGNRAEQSEALIDLNADLYRFDIELIADDYDWLISSAKWQRARLEDFGL